MNARPGLASLLRMGVTTALLAAVVGGCVLPHSMNVADSTSGAVPGSTGVAAGCRPTQVGDQQIRWIVPVREADARALDRWCATVGPPVVRSKPVLGPGNASAGDTLRIVTWNVHVGGGDLENFLQEELGLACGGRALAVAQPFVLLVQEGVRGSSSVPPAPDDSPVPGRIEALPPSGPRFHIDQVAERCGLSLFYVPSMRNGDEPGERGREDRGSAILSTLPIADLLAVELPLEAQRRVAVAATIELPAAGSLRVVSIHLDVAGSILRVLSSGGSMRVRQAAGLSDALDAVDPDRTFPTAIGGDLNTWSASETVILRMLEDYPDSPRPGKAKTRGAWPSDHMFFRRGAGGFLLVEGSYQVLTDEYGSDHRPRGFLLAPVGRP